MRLTGGRLGGATLGRRFALLAMLATAFPARAQAGFVIRSVPAEAVAESGSAARERARLIAIRSAWTRLVEANAQAADAPRLLAQTDAALDRLVEAFEVENERLSATRYAADFTIYFRPADTRLALGGGAASVAGTATEVRAAFAGIAEWVELRRRLASSPAVTRVEIRALSATDARLTLTLPGGPGAAIGGLGASGLVLAQDGPGWRLSLGGQR